MTVAGLAFLGALVLLVVTSPYPHETGVEVLRVVSSWPVILAVMAFVFRRQVSDFLKWLVVVLPGGTQIRSRQPELDHAVVQEKERELQMQQSLDSARVILSWLTEALVNTSIAKQEIKTRLDQLQRLLEQSQQAAVFWWCEYLLVSLSPEALLALAFISSRPMSDLEFYQALHPAVPSALVRVLVLNTLKAHGLVSVEGNTVALTEPGRNLLAHLQRRMQAQATT